MSAGRAGPAEPDVTAPPFVVLRGDGLVLRCLRQRDVEAHLAGEDDDQVRWLQEGTPGEPERTRQWVAESQEQWRSGGPRRSFGVFDAATDQLVGFAEANLELPGPRGGVNVSYAVFPPWRGRGLAARAVGLLCGWLAQTTAEPAAVLRIAPGNEPSHGVARAAGFAPVDASDTDGDDEGLVRYERPLR